MLDGRADDTDAEVIRHRLDVYDEVTRPVLNHYPSRKVLRINGSRPAEQVTADLRRTLDLILKPGQNERVLSEEW